MEKSVLVATSGGVDSTITTHLLKKQGFRVEAVHFVFINDKNVSRLRNNLAKIGIKLHVLNLKKEFESSVIKHFLAQYQNGATPNPCVFCNRFMKYEHLIKLADKLKINHIATGHYAKIANSKIKIPLDTKKDQTYFLWKIKPQWLKRIIWPLGNHQKHQIKNIASRLKLEFENVQESQEICFCQGKSTQEFLINRLPVQKSGLILDLDGKRLGKHLGLSFYTIGQRSGLPDIKKSRPDQPPIYVLGKDHKNNSLIIGEEKFLYKKEIKATSTNFFISKKKLMELSKNHKLYAKVRYGQPVQKIKIIKIKENHLMGEFNEPQRAITPGQSLVFYNNCQELIGGGIII